MNKDDILMAAQEESKKKNSIGEYEKEKARVGIMWASGICILVLAAMVVAELIVKKQFDLGKVGLFLLFPSVMNLYEGTRTKNKKMKVFGIIEAVFAEACFILYIGAYFV